MRIKQEEKTIFGIPGRLCLCSLLRSPYSTPLPLPFPLFLLLSPSLWLLRVYLRLATQCLLLLLLPAAYLLVWPLLLLLLLLLWLVLLLLLCAGVCNAIKVSLHIYLAISFVIIFGISNVFLPLCVSFKWPPQAHTDTPTHPHTLAHTNKFIGFPTHFKLLLRDFKNLPALCLRPNFAWKIKKAAGGMWQAAGGSCQAAAAEAVGSWQWQVSRWQRRHPKQSNFAHCPLPPTTLRMLDLAPKCRWVVWAQQLDKRLDNGRSHQQHSVCMSVRVCVRVCA